MLFAEFSFGGMVLYFLLFAAVLRWLYTKWFPQREPREWVKRGVLKMISRWPK